MGQRELGGGQRGQTLARTEAAHKQRSVPKKAASPSRPLQDGSQPGGKARIPFRLDVKDTHGRGNL